MVLFKQNKVIHNLTGMSLVKVLKKQAKQKNHRFLMITDIRKRAILLDTNPE